MLNPTSIVAAMKKPKDEMILELFKQNLMPSIMQLGSMVGQSKGQDAQAEDPLNPAYQVGGYQAPVQKRQDYGEVIRRALSGRGF